jgi:hypothetical protein
MEPRGANYTRPSDLPTVGVVFPREMRYIWTLLRARAKGLKVRSDGVEDVTGDFTPSLRRALEDLATRFLCSAAFCRHLDNLSFIYAFSFPFKPFGVV